MVKHKGERKTQQRRGTRHDSRPEDWSCMNVHIDDHGNSMTVKPSSVRIDDDVPRDLTDTTRRDDTTCYDRRDDPTHSNDHHGSIPCDDSIEGRLEQESTPVTIHNDADPSASFAMVRGGTSTVGGSTNPVEAVASSRTSLQSSHRKRSSFHRLLPINNSSDSFP